MDLPALADLIDELCDPHQHTERYEVWDRNRHLKTRFHRTTQPGLLQQLRDRYDQHPAGEDGGTSTPGSRPPLALEALATYIAIGGAAQRWATSLRLRPQPDAERRLRALLAAAKRLDSDTLAALHTEVRRWHNRASIVTGWTDAPWKPKVACPIPDCGKKDGLRIRFADQTAICVHCDAAWQGDDGSIMVLGRYVHRQTEQAA